MTFTSVNPHNPADVIGEWQAAGADGADAVVGRAMDAARAWADTPGSTMASALSDPASALEQRAADITDLVILEVCQPVSASRREVARAGAILRYYVQWVLAPEL